MTTEHYQISDDVDALIASLIHYIFAEQDLVFNPDLLDIIIHSNPNVEPSDLAVFFEYNLIQATNDDATEIAAYMEFGKELCEYVSADRLFVFKKEGMSKYISEHTVNTDDV